MNLKFHFEMPKKYNSVKKLSHKSWEKYLLFLSLEDSAFTKLPTHDDLVKIRKMRQHFQHKTQMVHIGIGGSCLGVKTIFEALKPKADIIFLENIEENIVHLFDQIDLKKTLFHIVSKSGNTTEVLAQLKFIIQKLKQLGVKPQQYKNYFLLTSSQNEAGILNRFAKDHELMELKIPDKLGGRYSVLSPVGLFPAHFFDLDIDLLVQGAQEAKEFLSLRQEDLKTMADCIVNLYQDHGINQNVIMPYNGRLNIFTQWFSQLWGESLGKKTESGFEGPTPIASLGSRDQHSLLQLYLHGPINKFIMFMSIENSSFELAPVVDALQAGCELALKDVERPYMRLSLNSLNEESLGELFQFFHYLTVLVADLLELYPYDQPAVELAKIHTKKLLKYDLSL